MPSCCLKLFSLPELPRAEAARARLAERYRDIAELWDTPLDGLIVTGTEPRAANLTDEPYWETLSKIVDWARDHTASTIWSCLAAHAAVLHADGIERRALKQKAVRRVRLPAGRRSSDDGAFSRAAVGAAFALQRSAGTRRWRLAAITFSPARRPPASILSPSRTAASFCSSRAIRNTRRIRCLREYRRDVGRFLARRARALSGNAARLFQ